jgi:hypothetical protein
MRGSSHIRIVSGVDRLRRNATEIYLDLTALDAVAQAAWLAFVSFSAETVGIEFTVERFAGLPPDEHADFAYLSDSAALTGKLLDSSSR